jgi:DNA-binding response OmpR family regulator
MSHPSGTPDLPTVIVVDDDEATLAALRRTFRNEPYQVLTTQDPFEAWSWIRSRAVALVIADEFMPGMLGTELLRAARRQSPSSAQAVLTGHPGTLAGSRAFEQGVDLFILKPWQDDALRASVRQLVSGEGRLPKTESPWDEPSGAD